ncbi:MAG TPA: hypothetical protein VN614_06080 [Rhodanobacter sp.]|jgi:hypothetical protein|nr:hypothetical protein [Rhodanobacter sp.]
MRFATLLKGTLTTLLLGATVAMVGCSLLGGTKKNEVTTASMKGQFDTVIKAYKDGQFIVDGGVLSAIDTGSHFAYLKDQGKLPKTVLLEPSDDSKIRKQHLQYLARMQLDYGFRAYYDDKGTLVEINPKDTKARALQDATPRHKPSDQGGEGLPGADGKPLIQ